MKPGTKTGAKKEPKRAAHEVIELEPDDTSADRFIERFWL